MTVDYAQWTIDRKQNAFDRVTHNKKLLFNILKKNKITGGYCEFDGSGDSGSIGDVTIEEGHKDNIFLEPVFGAKILEHVQYSKEGGQEFILKENETNVGELIQAICYDFLEYHHCGWETNDGSYGNFSFSVADDKFYLTFYERRTECYEYEI